MPSTRIAISSWDLDLDSVVILQFGFGPSPPYAHSFALVRLHRCRSLFVLSQVRHSVRPTSLHFTSHRKRPTPPTLFAFTSLDLNALTQSWPLRITSLHVASQALAPLGIGSSHIALSVLPLALKFASHHIDSGLSSVYLSASTLVRIKRFITITSS
ncbi:hypothetical protein CVT24_012873 [Panaeolus cyanescens]|uniref:Uncharacterized protein n=1 Tax=Panaeolus cyanescens TaxID=181874 RepID=A0A409XB34_9AGAR|nr:hypothetical protein CVT24_012873 [Panaeolus cyanescens]